MGSIRIKAFAIIIILTGSTLLYLQNPDILDNDNLDSEIESTSTVTQVIDTDIQTSEILNTKNYKIASIEIFSSPLIQPVGIRNANDGSNRLFVIDQAGEILILANNSGSFVTSLFLDIKNKVINRGEQDCLD